MNFAMSPMGYFSVGTTKCLKFHTLLSWGLCCLLLLGLNVYGKGAGAVHVRGYTRKDGTYVAPHMRSAPNARKADNWSQKGNVNPYTGKAGTKNSSSATVPAQPLPTPRQKTPESEGAKEIAEPPVQPLVKQAAPQPQKITPLGEDLTKQTFSMRYEQKDQVLESQKENAAKGMPESQYVLGMRYLQGNGIPKDDEKGRELLQKAADQGNMNAHDKLRELDKKPKLPRS